MSETPAIKVKFEALGKVHVKYSNEPKTQSIIDTVKMICPTATVIDLVPVTVSLTVYNQNHLDSIKDWVQNNEKRFSHIDAEALK